MEKPSVAFDPLPNSLPLRGKRALATHPPSCHPRRVFGSLENEKENEKNREQRGAEAGELKASPITLLIDSVMSHYNVAWALNTAPKTIQITKMNKRNQLLQG